MTYVLSLRSHSPLKRSFSDNPYLDSYPPRKDSALLGPLSDITARNTSTCSLYSFGNSRTGDWSHGNENTPPPASQSLLDFAPDYSGFPFGIKHANDEPRKRTCGIGRPAPSFSRVHAPSNPYSRKSKGIRHVVESSSEDSSAKTMEIDDSKAEESELFNLYEAIRVPLPECHTSDKLMDKLHEKQQQILVTTVGTSQPFRRWMSILRRRHAQARKHRVAEVPRISIDTVNDDCDTASSDMLPDSVRRASMSMSSSMGCVTAMKSASITVAGTSIAPRSDAGLQGKIRLGNRSSHYSDARRSGDSHRGALGPVLDESAWLRSLQRRKVVEELLASEESYVADLKVLINVCRFRRMLIKLY